LSASIPHRAKVNAKIYVEMLVCIMAILLIVEWSYSGCASFTVAQYVSTYNQAAWHGTWWWIPDCFPWGMFWCTYLVLSI